MQRSTEAHRDAGPLRVAAVLPVAGSHGLLAGCVDALLAQERAIDEVIVVDDSPNGALTEIEGVRILRSGGRGPYAARNIGWRSTEADVVLFLDVRSRPHPSWARRLREAFDDPAVALAGSEVRVLSGEAVGARAAARHQFFRLRNYLSNPFFLPYLPTCNLAARRDDLAAVDGFLEVRSGADADLCWRILSRSGRELRAIEDVLMDWVPRTGIWAYIEQNYRYGKSNYMLRRRWEDAGCPQLEPLPRAELAKLVLRRATRTGIEAARRDPDRLLARMYGDARAAFKLGYRLAAEQERRARRRDCAYA